MPGVTPTRSWQVTPAAFRTPALAVIGLVALLGVSEFMLRLPAVRAALYSPSVGSTSRAFELQLDGLDHYAASRDHVQCIVLGSSTAMMGVDPDALSSGYRERTGNELQCFNFGVLGMTASAAGAVAPILVNQYRPRLLIYVVSPRDVGQSVDGPLLANTPWVRYRRGQFSFNGWLTEHSATFRYYLLYRQWLDPVRWPAARNRANSTGAGFFPMNSSMLLTPASWAHTQRTYAAIMNQPPSEPELAGLSRIMELAGNGTDVVVVEAPVHQQLRRWTQHVSDFYVSATARIRQAARQHRVTFRRVPTWRVVPADGWADFVHLNRRGAARFSEWLGARIAVIVQEGRFKAPHATLAQG